MALLAVRLGDVLGRECFTAECILPACSRTAVKRIAATALTVVTDEMVENHSLRNWSYLTFITNSVNQLLSPIDSYFSVTTTNLGPDPCVASVLLYNPARRIRPVSPWHEGTYHRRISYLADPDTLLPTAKALAHKDNSWDMTFAE